MKLLFGIALATFVVVFGTRAIGKRIPLTGWFQVRGRDLFLLLGILIGPLFLNIMTDEYQVGLQPVLVTGLGWIGFLFGMNLEWRTLKRINRDLILFIMGQSIFTMAVISLASYWLLGVFWSGDLSVHILVPIILALAACGGGTAQGTLMSLRSERWFRGPQARTIQVAATLDDLPSLLVVAVTAAGLHGYTSTSGSLVVAIKWFGVQFILGLLFGYLLKLLMDRTKTPDVQLLMILGTVALAAGAAGVLQLSPLFVCSVAGVVFANSKRREVTVFSILQRSEFTIYVMFLVMVGCRVTFAWYVLPIAAGYILSRALGKVIGVGAFGRLLKTESNSSFLGLAMFPQAGMAIALAVDFSMLSVSNVYDWLIAVIVLSVFFNSFFAVPLTKVAVRQGGS